MSAAPEVGSEAWTWSLMVSEGGVAVELLRDDQHKLTIPLDPMQVELLMDKPISLYSVFKDAHDEPPEDA